MLARGHARPSDLGIGFPSAYIYEGVGRYLRLMDPVRRVWFDGSRMARLTRPIVHGRRHFLQTGALTLGAVQLGLAGRPQASQRLSREVAAIANAPEWLNSPRLTASSLAGKVVLVDFWTYTCINWLRTLPYVRAWAQKYQPDVAVIGVHTPEFPFERNLDNVRRAVQQMRIEYPIVIDNDYAIWRAFRNQYWPALYLRRRKRARSRPSFRRRRVRHLGASHSATAEGGWCVRCERWSRVGRWPRFRGGR